MTATGGASRFSASAAALGYLYQCRLGLVCALRRLRENEDFQLSLETLDDVVFERNGEPAEILQAKHHRKGSANLTDASVDIWKTLRIWCEGVAAGTIPQDAALYLVSTSTATEGHAPAYLRATDRDPQRALDRLTSTAQASTNPTNAAAYAAFQALSGEQQLALLERVYVLDASPNILDSEEELRGNRDGAVECAAVSFQIRDIVLYGHAGQRRVLPLRPGTVNVITGGSATGKTALIHIGDYCLGSRGGDQEGRVVVRSSTRPGRRPSVRRAAGTGAWRPVFDGRVLRGRYRDRTPRCGIVATEHNVDAATQILSRAAGIGPFIHEPPQGQTRSPVAATIRHALYYTFQPQYEINQPEHLFHGQSDHWNKQSLKDTLPFFLGAVDNEFVAKKEELRRLRRSLREREKRLATMEAVRGEGLGKAGALVAEAEDLGLLDGRRAPETIEETFNILREVLAASAVDQVKQNRSRRRWRKPTTD
jgi:hypothetical protein